MINSSFSLNYILSAIVNHSINLFGNILYVSDEEDIKSSMKPGLSSLN